MVNNIVLGFGIAIIIYVFYLTSKALLNRKNKVSDEEPEEPEEIKQEE